MCMPLRSSTRGMRFHSRARSFFHKSVPVRAAGSRLSSTHTYVGPLLAATALSQLRSGLAGTSAAVAPQKAGRTFSAAQHRPDHATPHSSRSWHTTAGAAVSHTSPLAAQRALSRGLVIQQHHACSASEQPHRSAACKAGLRRSHACTHERVRSTSIKERRRGRGRRQIRISKLQASAHNAA